MENKLNNRVFFIENITFKIFFSISHNLKNFNTKVAFNFKNSHFTCLYTTRIKFLFYIIVMTAI